MRIPRFYINLQNKLQSRDFQTLAELYFNELLLFTKS